MNFISIRHIYVYVYIYTIIRCWTEDFNESCFREMGSTELMTANITSLLFGREFDYIISSTLEYSTW